MSPAIVEVTDAVGPLREPATQKGGFDPMSQATQRTTAPEAAVA